MLELEEINIKDFLKIEKDEFELSQKNIEYLRKQYDKLRKEYGGRIVIISNGEVIGTLDKNIREKIEEARKRFEEITRDFKPAEMKTMLLVYIPKPDEVLMYHV